MIQQFSKVRVVKNPNIFLNDSMIEWIEDHKDCKFKVERIYEDTVKLFKVNFWITLNLIEEVDE